MLLSATKACSRALSCYTRREASTMHTSAIISTKHKWDLSWQKFKDTAFWMWWCGWSMQQNNLHMHLSHIHMLTKVVPHLLLSSLSDWFAICFTINQWGEEGGRELPVLPGAVLWWDEDDLGQTADVEGRGGREIRRAGGGGGGCDQSFWSSS